MSEIEAGVVLEGYEFVREIGSGGFSSVWLVKSLQFNRLFVAKIAIVKTDIEDAWQAFDCEIKALLRLDHPNIIKLYAHFRYVTNFILILEYCENGSLADYIKKNGALTGAVLVQTVKDICVALNFAWSLGVQHRDVKPENIMFNENGRVKLVDFGISVVQKGKEMSKEVSDFRSSPICAAPEILRKIPFDPVKSDIWATGITILWMARGEVPWLFQNGSELEMMIRYGQYVVPDGMDPAIEVMVRKMLTVAPGNRRFPTDEEVNALGAENVVRARIRKPPHSLMTCASNEQMNVTEGFKVSPSLGCDQVKKMNAGSLVMKAFSGGKPKVGSVRIKPKRIARKTWQALPITSVPLEPMEAIGARHEGETVLPDIVEENRE